NPPRQLSLADRQSPELIIAFSGTAGCGMNSVVDQAVKILEASGYEVHTINLTKIIHQSAKVLQIPISNDVSSKTYLRYKELQDAGNTLRERFSNRVLAEIAISQIAAHRSAYLAAIE